jgi:hypothetical protein
MGHRRTKEKRRGGVAVQGAARGHGRGSNPGLACPETGVNRWDYYYFY